ncbi:hypothetical protein Q3G72_022429 [Acer saccharum]|nr:hypothetical protein Q3G72_022429 [Acer saccharum]
MKNLSTPIEKERKEEKKREIVVAGLIESAAPLAVGTDAFARRRRLQLQSDTVVVVALVRRSRCFCSSTLLPLLVNAVTFTRRHCLQLPVMSNGIYKALDDRAVVNALYKTLTSLSV